MTQLMIIATGCNHPCEAINSMKNNGSTAKAERRTGTSILRLIAAARRPRMASMERRSSNRWSGRISGFRWERNVPRLTSVTR